MESLNTAMNKVWNERRTRICKTQTIAEAERKRNHLSVCILPHCVILPFSDWFCPSPCLPGLCPAGSVPGPVGQQLPLPLGLCRAEAVMEGSDCSDWPLWALQGPLSVGMENTAFLLPRGQVFLNSDLVASLLGPSFSLWIFLEGNVLSLRQSCVNRRKTRRKRPRRAGGAPADLGVIRNREVSNEGPHLRSKHRTQRFFQKELFQNFENSKLENAWLLALYAAAFLLLFHLPASLNFTLKRVVCVCTPKADCRGPRQLEEGWVRLGRFERTRFLHPVVRNWDATSWGLWVSMAPNSCNPVVGGSPPTLFFKWMRIKWPWGERGEGIEMPMPMLSLLSSYYIFLKTKNSAFFIWLIM